MNWIIQEAARRQTLGAAGTISEIAVAIREEAEAAMAALYPPEPLPAATDVVARRFEPGRVVEVLGDGSERTAWEELSDPQPEQEG